MSGSPASPWISEGDKTPLGKIFAATDEDTIGSVSKTTVAVGQVGDD